MQSIAECYRKVSKDCFKFIRSQETSKEKFKNKEKMIKSFLIPISFWINNRTNKSNRYFAESDDPTLTSISGQLLAITAMLGPPT